QRPVKRDAILFLDVVLPIPANIGCGDVHFDILTAYAARRARISVLPSHCGVSPSRCAPACAVLGGGRKTFVCGRIQPRCSPDGVTSGGWLFHHIPPAR